MRRYFCPLVLLFAAVTLLASCLSSDNEDIVYSDDVAITTFSIKSAEMTVYTTSSTGEDSTYVTSNTSLSSYKFVIDHAKGEVYNVDSLPYNIDASKILVSCTTKNNGIAALRSIEKPDSMVYLTADTIDFTQPRTVAVFSASGMYSRDYTVKVNVHKQNGDVINWHQVTTNSDLASLTNMRGFQLGDLLYVLGVKDGQTMVYGSIRDDNHRNWDLLATLSENASLNAVVRNDSLFVLDGTDLKVSVDGVNYKNVAVQAPITRLVAQSSMALYGIGDSDNMLMSEDAGKTWVADEVDFGTVIPTRDITYTVVDYPNVPNAECVIVTGNRDAEAYPQDTTAVVLTKIVEKTAGARKNAWSGIVGNSWDANLLPRMNNLTIFPYDDAAYVLGGNGIGDCDVTAFSAFYRSVDCGFSWRKSVDMKLPDGFESSPASFAVFVDSDKNVWIVCGASGAVWRGRLNRVGWSD